MHTFLSQMEMGYVKVESIYVCSALEPNNLDFGP